MCKDNYSIIINPFICIFLFLIFLYPSIAIASNDQNQSNSIITLPIEADLSVLEDYLNEFIPNELADINEPDKICVQPQYTEIPSIPKCKMKGFKISCKDRSIEIRTTPPIRCDLKGWIKRNGRITISGQGNKMTFVFPIKAQASANGLLYGTAKAAAVLYLDATPHFNKDWSLSVDIAPDFIWSNKPTLKLFDLIKINIEKILEPKLRKRMDKFVKRVPTLLENLDIKGKVTEVWEDIQEPLKLDDDSDVYLLFKPEVASCSEFNIVGNVLHHTSSAEGKTQIILGKPPVDYNKTALTDLESICHKEGKFNFHLPVLVTYDELLAIVKKKYFDRHSVVVIKSGIAGILKISDPKIKKGHEGRISISADISYDKRSEWLRTIDIFNWFDIDGEITFSGLPKIEKETRTLIFDDLVYDSSTNSDLFDLLVDAAELRPVQSYFESLIEYQFGKKVDESIAKANKSLNSLSQDDINVSAQLEILSVESIMVNKKDITINTKLSGVVNANTGL